MNMKLIILKLLLFTINFSYAQNCIPVAIVFTTQQQVDDFPANYPGCSFIDGNVGITGEDITNLDSLIQITQIGGSLQILNTSNLISLHGLDSLNTIGSSLIINSASSLTNLNGLGQLNSIGSSLNVTSCNTLTSISGIGNITSLSGDLNLLYNSNLTNISSLNSLTNIGGNLIIRSSSYNIVNASGLSALQTVGGQLEFSGNINNISSMNALTTVVGQLGINNNNHITDISGFHNLTSVSDLNISHNNNLISIHGFQNLENLDFGIRLDYNPFLSDIDAFDHTMTFFSLYINNNPFLSQCAVEAFCNKLWQDIGSVHVSNNGTNCNSTTTILQNCGDAPDADGDGIIDALDNCIEVSNPDQADWNNDGIGDACQDTDGDTIMDDIDNCREVANTDQADCNDDGIGDVCTNFILDTTVTTCYFFTWVSGDGNTYTESGVYQFDSTFINGCTYSYTLNLTITNIGSGYITQTTACNEYTWHEYNNGNGETYTESGIYTWYIDECFRATLNLTINTVGNNIDQYESDCTSFIWTNADWQTYTESGVYYYFTIGANSCPDTLTLHLSINEGNDADNDGLSDDCDNCPNVANPDQLDCNNNGIGDACELLDTDCDGIFDIDDNCPNVFNPFQTDLNNNGIGDACEDFPRMGLNTMDPLTELHLSNGTLYLDNPEKGIILKNHQNQCFILKMNGTNLVATQIPCP